MMTFFLANVLPGDPARMAAGQFSTPEQIQEVSERLGLDKPLPVQYFRYLGRLVRLDLGESLTSRQEVLKELGKFYPATLELTAFAIMIAVLIGTPLGVITGTGKKCSITDIYYYWITNRVSFRRSNISGEHFFLGRNWYICLGRIV